MTEGQTIPELTRRVQSVFSRLSKTRAEMIARTEAARAVHAASLISAKESGVVSGKKWLLSGDACPYCHEVAAKFPGGVGLDAEFNNDGKGQTKLVQMPPLHRTAAAPSTYVLTDEYEKLLAEHGPPEPERFDYDGGSLGPEPKRRKIARPGSRPNQNRKPIWTRADFPKPDGVVRIMLRSCRLHRHHDRPAQTQLRPVRARRHCLLMTAAGSSSTTTAGQRLC